MSRVLANSLTFLDGARVQACLIWDPSTKVWNGKAQVGCMYIVINCPSHAILLLYLRIDMASKPHLKKCAPAGVWYLEHAAGRLARCGWVILDRETGFKKKLKYCQPRQLSKEACSQGFTRWVLKDVESVGYCRIVEGHIGQLNIAAICCQHELRWILLQCKNSADEKCAALGLQGEGGRFQDASERNNMIVSLQFSMIDCGGVSVELGSVLNSLSYLTSAFRPWKKIRFNQRGPLHHATSCCLCKRSFKLTSGISDDLRLTF